MKVYFKAPSEIQSRNSLWGSSYESFVKHVLVINRSRIYDILWKLREERKTEYIFQMEWFHSGFRHLLLNVYCREDSTMPKL